MNLLRDFSHYLKAVFTEGQPLVFTAFDIVGIVLFFFPHLAESLVKDETLARAVGGLIFFASFFLANFSLYRRLTRNVTSSLNEQSLRMYPHKNSPYNAVKMLYVGSEIAKDFEAQIFYRDTSGKEQSKTVTDFFPKEDPRMWQYHYKYDFLEQNQVAYFHLIGKKHTQDGRATVVAKFTGATSGKSVQVEREFQLQDF
jgi:hypothetical protein